VARVRYSLFMTKTQARTARLQMNAALDQAFEETEYLAAARCCLETALVHCRTLAIGKQLERRDQHRVNETFAALAARGWC